MIFSRALTQSVYIRRTCCAALASRVASSILVVRVRAGAHLIWKLDDVENIEDFLSSLVTGLLVIVMVVAPTQPSRVIEHEEEKPRAIHLQD